MTLPEPRRCTIDGTRPSARLRRAVELAAVSQLPLVVLTLDRLDERTDWRPDAHEARRVLVALAELPVDVAPTMTLTTASERASAPVQAVTLVHPVDRHTLAAPCAEGWNAAALTERVRDARRIIERAPLTYTNQALELAQRAEQRLGLDEAAMEAVGWIAEAAAALAGGSTVKGEHIAEALSYRNLAHDLRAA